MKKTRNLSKNFFDGKKYDVLILDVNSLYLFGGKNSIRQMYEFIESIKKATGNHRLLVINVIDNGISPKLLKKYPNYKGNRKHSVQSNNITINKFSKSRAFKSKIDTIHKTDSKIKTHLTFYIAGESDFKVGWLLKYLHEYTTILPSEVLTVSFDKDFVLCSALSDVILKRVKNNIIYWHLIDKNCNLTKLTELLRVNKLKLKNPFDFFYYLLLNGDEIDNIPQILTPAKSIRLINEVVDKYGHINMQLLSKHISNYSNIATYNDLLDNSYLVDLYNVQSFPTNILNNMKYVFNSFLRNNNIRILE